MTLPNILKAIGFMIEAILAGLALLVLASAIKTFLIKAVIGIIGAVVAVIGAGPALILAAIAGLALIIVGEIASHWNELKEAGGNLIQGIWQGIKDAVANVGAWIKEHIFDPFINGFKKAFDIASPSKVMEEQGGFIIDGLLGGITAAWGGIIDFFSGALDGLKATLGGAWEFISGAASDAWNGISTTLSGIVGGIASTIGDTWENIKTATGEKWEQVTTALGNTWESVKTAAGDKFKAVKETVSGAWESISKDADGALKGVVKDVSGKWNDIKTDASKVWGDIQTELPKKAEEIKTGVVSKVRELASQALPFWRQTHTDAQREWKQTENDVTQSANNVKTRIASAFQSLQGTLSGIWGGIRSAASGALSAVSAAVSSMVSSISSKVSSVRSTVSNITSSASDALSRVANKMDDLTRKAASTVTIGGLASGGVVTNSGHIRSWYDSVRKYASGTTRAAGSLFVAGEAGPEIVGHVNGRTEVLNESQIAGAIYSAVLSAMSEALKTLGGFLSQQMAANTNALIAAIGQIQPPQQIAMPQDTALLERLAALQAVPYQVPAYATGTVMPYEVVAEIRRQTSELKTAMKDEGEEIIRAVVSAISNHGLAVTNAIGNIQTAPQQGYGPERQAQYTVEYINRMKTMMGKSPLTS
ncbi:MAG: hypothetical protein IJK52_04675 [Oscillospiraceae bacterium]|nr:hypothetical protein [Oscillospiraceae bacterium]